MVLVPSIDIYQQPSMQLNIQTTEVEFTKRVVSNKSANVTIKRRPSRCALCYQQGYLTLSLPRCLLH